jgi:hypothetical protein
MAIFIKKIIKKIGNERLIIAFNIGKDLIK